MYPIENKSNQFYVWYISKQKMKYIGDYEDFIRFLANGYIRIRRCDGAFPNTVTSARHGEPWIVPNYYWLRFACCQNDMGHDKRINDHRYYYCDSYPKEYQFFDGEDRCINSLVYERPAYEYYLKHYAHLSNIEAEVAYYYESRAGRERASIQRKYIFPSKRSHWKRQEKNYRRVGRPNIGGIGELRRASYVDEDYKLYSKGEKKYIDWDFWREDTRIVEQNWKSQRKTRHQWDRGNR